MFRKRKYDNFSILEERLKYLEDNLAQVQASTKTLFNFFTPVHNQLRISFKPYYFWHLVRYSSLIHWAVLLLTIIYLIALFSALTSTQFLQISYDEKTGKQYQALISTDELTSQADWQAGEYDAKKLDLLTSPDNMKIKQDQVFTISAWCSGAPPGNANAAMDNNLSTWWDADWDLCAGWPPAFAWWKLDLAENYEIKKFFVSVSTAFASPNQQFKIQSSVNDVDWTDQVPLTSFTAQFPSYSSFEFDVNINEARYIRFYVPTDPLGSQDVLLDEFSTDIKYQAIHASAPDQIGDTGDPDRYTVEYQSFTPSESEPANSDITYRFRLTTSDGSSTGSWTDYVDYIGSTINLTTYDALAITQDKIDAGITYLQVETKFERTDLSADPVVSDYSVVFDSNKPPFTPLPS